MIFDEDTGLYFYGSRYYDPELARFIQADTIVPSSTTSQALNRYTYVNNNPLKFTDPTGHGWFSDFFKKFIGTIITVALSFIAPWGTGFWATLSYAAIGSAVSTAVNGGTFASFAIGMGIGLAAGCISNAMGISILGKNNWGAFIKDPIGMFASGALQGSIMGAISSAVYGQNIWKGMGYGALGGLTGTAVAISIAAAISFGKTVIEEFKLSGVEAISRIAQAIGSVAIKVANIAINIALTTANVAVGLTIFPFQAAGALIADIIYGSLEEGLAVGEDRVTGRLHCMLVKALRFNTLIGYNWTPSADEIHLTYGDFKAGVWGSLPHEFGHGFQAWLGGLFYYITVVPLSPPANILKYNLGIQNSPIHVFENDADNRAKILFFAPGKLKQIGK